MEFLQVKGSIPKFLHKFWSSARALIKTIEETGFKVKNRKRENRIIRSDRPPDYPVEVVFFL